MQASKAADNVVMDGAQQKVEELREKLATEQVRAVARRACGRQVCADKQCGHAQHHRSGANSTAK